MIELADIKLLFRAPDTLGLYGICYAMKTAEECGGAAQSPKDLWVANGRAAPEDWRWLGQPGWWGKHSVEQQEALVRWFRRLVDIPTGPYEWCEVVLGPEEAP